MKGIQCDCLCEFSATKVSSGSSHILATIIIPSWLNTTTKASIGFGHFCAASCQLNTFILDCSMPIDLMKFERAKRSTNKPSFVRWIILVVASPKANGTIFFATSSWVDPSLHYGHRKCVWESSFPWRWAMVTRWITGDDFLQPASSVVHVY